MGLLGTWDSISLPNLVFHGPEAGSEAGSGAMGTTLLCKLC